MDHPGQDSNLASPIPIMIVEDDILVRTMVADLLSHHDDLLITGVFPDGPEALAAAAENPPELMVVDISMPGMGGAELTRQIRELHPSVQVLAYTSLADERAVSEMLSAGAAGVVYKEASVSALADAIRASHSGLSVLSPRFTRSLAHAEFGKTLSDTEMEILRLMSRGLTNEQIAPIVCLSASTVKYHLTRLSTKLGAHNRVTLAVAAVHLGLLRRTTPDTA